MSDAGRYPESRDAATEFAGGSARPRWASVLGACIVALVIVLIVVLHLSGVINPSGH